MIIYPVDNDYIYRNDCKASKDEETHVRLSRYVSLM